MFTNVYVYISTYILVVQMATEFRQALLDLRMMWLQAWYKIFVSTTPY